VGTENPIFVPPGAGKQGFFAAYARFKAGIFYFPK
jgi:hypothetical protein